MASMSCFSWIILSAFVLSCDGSVNLFRLFKHQMLRNRNPPSENVSAPASDWFTQILDHFQPTDDRTWQQRYWVERKYYKHGGPMFLMIEGEGEARPEFMFSSEWVEYAKKHNALMFYIEHRYYGKSRPTSDLSLENLKYLSSEQALADLAYFITSMNQQHKLPPDTKWVAFGGSYAGNLAAWVRYKYPHLVYASVASSAPVLAEAYNFPSEDVFDYIKDCLDPKCAKTIEATYKEVNLVSTPSSWQNNTDKLRYITLISNLGRDCLLNTYENEIKLLKNTDYNSSSVGMRQWEYQACTQFGYFPGNFHECEVIFGQRFNEHFVYQAVNRTNMIYGGLNIKATRVIYVNGSLDLWRKFAITKTRIPESPAIYIKGGCHCTDMDAPKKEDSPALKAARKEISMRIGKWLKE